MIIRIRIGAAALAVAALSITIGTAAKAEQPTRELGAHYLHQQGILKETRAEAAERQAVDAQKAEAARDMTVWGSQIERRGWDGEQNFPVKHPQRALNVHDVPAATAFRGFTSNERRAVQRQLQADGYYGGQIDGKWGPQTWAAVQGYARDAGVFADLRDRRGSYAVFQNIMH